MSDNKMIFTFTLKYFTYIGIYFFVIGIDQKVFN